MSPSIYRVTHHVVQNTPLTSNKSSVLAWPGLRPKRNFYLKSTGYFGLRDVSPLIPLPCLFFHMNWVESGTILHSEVQISLHEVGWVEWNSCWQIEGRTQPLCFELICRSELPPSELDHDTRFLSFSFRKSTTMQSAMQTSLPGKACSTSTSMAARSLAWRTTRTTRTRRRASATTRTLWWPHPQVRERNLAPLMIFGALPLKTLKWVEGWRRKRAYYFF